MSKRYKAGRIFEPEHFTEVKKWTNEDRTWQEVWAITGWKRGTIEMVAKAKDYAEYRQLRNSRIYGIKNPELIQNNQVNVSQTKLETEIDELDKLFGQLKDQIEKVVILTIEQRVIDYKKETEAELISLRTVVDAAKKNNIAESLKDRLMGSFLKT